MPAARSLPAAVVVGPFAWTVRTDPKLEEFGTTTLDDLEIVLRATMPDDLRRETLFHELLHAVLFVMGVPATAQEKWVRKLSPLLFATLRDDPQLRRYLFG